jgi:hypothetical protein
VSFYGEVDDEHCTTLNSFDQMSHLSSNNYNKRKATCNDEEEEPNRRRFRVGYERSDSIENGLMMSIAKAMDYTSSLHCHCKGNNKSNTAIDDSVNIGK